MAESLPFGFDFNDCYFEENISSLLASHLKLPKHFVAGLHDLSAFPIKDSLAAKLK